MRGPSGRNRKSPREPTRRGDEVADQNLSRLRSIAEPFGHHHGSTEVVVLGAGRLPRLQPHPYGESRFGVGSVVVGYPSLDGEGTTEGCQGAGEGHHEAIPQTLHLVTAGLGDGLSEEGEVGLSEFLGRVFPQVVEQLGRSDEVGEEERDHSLE